jgi:hypothetical protein
MARTPRQVYFGASGTDDAFEPDKVDIVEMLEVMDFTLAAKAMGAITFGTLAQANGSLGYEPWSTAWVLDDPVPTNNGWYTKTGTSGAGGWVRLGDLPYSFIRATNSGAGSANAIVATTATPLPAADGGALISLNITVTTTAAPVTVALNGGSPLSIKTSSGNDPAPGGLVAGMMVAGYKAGSEFRLLSDQASAAIITAAEAWAVEAKDARDDAIAAAAGVNLPPVSADTMLVDNAAGTARESKTFEDVRRLIEARKDDLTLKAVNSLVYDMHFGALKAKGWMTGEAGGNVDYVLASGASAGARSITLTSGSAKPIPAQLIAYLGTDGEYYSAVVSGVAGNLVTLTGPLAAPVAAGANAHNFYINESHPNFWGYQVIADDMIRRKIGYWRQVHAEPPAARGGASIAPFATNNAASPGSSAGGAWQVTPAGTNTGCEWTKWRPSRTGRYRAVIHCNRGAVDNNNDVAAHVMIGGLYHYSRVIDSADPDITILDFSVMDVADVQFRVTKASAAAFFISDLRILEFQGAGFDGFDAGRHFVFGDSWAAISTDIGQGIGIIDRLRERFPRATFVNKGVGGNKASDMVARFDADIAADVAANGPVKSMIIIDGTNDYYGAVAPAEVATSLGVLISRTIALGITPITFTSSVGSYTESAARFALSRRYALEIPLVEQHQVGWRSFTPAISGTTSAGAGTYAQQEGRYRRDGDRVDFVVNLSWSAHTGTGNMEVAGLPFAAAGLSYPCALAYSGLTYASSPIGYVSAKKIVLAQAASGASLSALAMDTAALLYLSGSYYV